MLGQIRMHLQWNDSFVNEDKCIFSIMKMHDPNITKEEIIQLKGR